MAARGRFNNRRRPPIRRSVSGSQKSAREINASGTAWRAQKCDPVCFPQNRPTRSRHGACGRFSSSLLAFLPTKRNRESQPRIQKRDKQQKKKNRSKASAGVRPPVFSVTGEPMRRLIFPFSGRKVVGHRGARRNWCQPACGTLFFAAPAFRPCLSETK